MVTSITQTQPMLSLLRETFVRDDKTWLHQSKISEMVAYENFAAMASVFVAKTRYPAPQAHKLQTYSFAPVVFNESNYVPKTQPDKAPQWGLWRTGATCLDCVTVGYFDLDNQHEDHDHIDLDAVQTILTELGLSYILYTSFSHLKKNGRHKVRILVPISRNVDYDTMFLVYVWLNYILSYQLDGSIYDPGDHLYGPTYDGEYREWLGGQALNVDVVLAKIEGLPSDALQFAQRAKTKVKASRTLTPEEIEQYKSKVADTSVGRNVSLDNPAICNPKWLIDADALYKDGSHRQTLMGIMSRIWLKSKGSLSFGDMQSLQYDVDARWGYYCQRTYSRDDLSTDLKSVMALPVSHTTSPVMTRDQALAREMSRLSKRWTKSF